MASNPNTAVELSNFSEEYIPIATPNLGGNEARYLMECIQTNFVSSVGPFVKKFENEILRITKAKYAVPTCSGTSALHLSLKIMGVNQNELVIIPSLTFIATANAVKYCGADPWIFDVSSHDWGLDPVVLEQILLKETEFSKGGLIHAQSKKRIAAIILVCTLGIPPSINEILDIGKKFNLPLILDAAGAIGSKYKNKELGELDCDCTILSFNGNKLITTGGGGCILLKDETLANRARHLSTTARSSTSYLHDEIGYNYRMTNIAAALGCAQVENLNAFLLKKKYIAEQYNQISSLFKNVKAFPYPKNTHPNHWLTGLLLPNSTVANKLVETLNKINIGAQKFWIPIHRQPPYLNSLHTPQGYTESIYDNIVILPSSSHLSDEKIAWITSNLIKALHTLQVT